MFKPIAAASAIAAMFTPACYAEQIDGKYELGLVELFAIDQTGMRAADGDGYCLGEFANYIATFMSGAYTINSKSRTMSATADYYGSTVNLYPLSIAERYAFMSRDIPQPLTDLRVKRIVLNMSTDFTSIEGEIMFGGKETYNCILSNFPPN